MEKQYILNKIERDGQIKIKRGFKSFQEFCVLGEIYDMIDEGLLIKKGGFIDWFSSYDTFYLKFSERVNLHPDIDPFGEEIWIN